MSTGFVDCSQIAEMSKRFAQLRDNFPKMMEQLTLGEGVHAVGEARKICYEDKIVDNGTYRMNFHTGSRGANGAVGDVYDGTAVRRSGGSYRIDVYNNLDYAKHLEYGFRSHFVPIHYFTPSFVARYMARKGLSEAPKGIYVGPYKGFVKGHFTLRRALRRTQQTQDERLGKKLKRMIRQQLDGKGGGA